MTQILDEDNQPLSLEFGTDNTTRIEARDKFANNELIQTVAAASLNFDLQHPFQPNRRF
jgi:hypothetical protein